MMRVHDKFIELFAVAWFVLGNALVAQPHDLTTISIRTRDGRSITGTTEQSALMIEVDGTAREISIRDVLSIHSAASASKFEEELIVKNLDVLGQADLKQSEIAAAELTDIGLPVISPLLKAYVDTDAHEPDYRYRLFDRILPGHVDGPDRTLGLIRLADQSIRGNLISTELSVTEGNGKRVLVPLEDIRRIAVLRDVITRNFELQALHHCSYVGYLDTGILVNDHSTLTMDAKGYVRLSFDEDGWSSDPDGIADPLPGKRRLQEGFRWGSVLGRVGPDGERWFAGKHIDKTDLGSGRLYFVINDNEHWQNNIGSYRVKLTVKNAFDVGESD